VNKNNAGPIIPYSAEHEKLEIERLELEAEANKGKEETKEEKKN